MREPIEKLIGLFAIAVLAVGCGGGGGGDGDDSSPPSTSAAEAAAAEEADDGAEEQTADADPCTDDLQIVNVEAETSAEVPEGAFAAETMWADRGPHPDNTVDDDAALELGLFTFVQEADEQFGITIPIAPEVPDGEHFVSIRLQGDDAIAPGQLFVDQLVAEERDDADGTILFSSWEYGSSRLLPGSFEVTITELTDEVVCGEIQTVTETDLQQFIGLEGTFVADRSQHLESLEG